MNIAEHIDHTILKPSTLDEDVRTLCSDALHYKFAAVCVSPPFIKLSKALLQGSDVKTATVIGFPFGYSVPKAKLVEVEEAIDSGADELDVVINLTKLKSGKWNELKEEMRPMIYSIHANSKIIKVIIESGILTNEEIIRCCEIYAALGVDFVKTSTGYAETGATIDAVQLIRAHLPSGIKIKASGGIRTYEAAKQFIDAGAERIGTSSGVTIVKQQSGST